MHGGIHLTGGRIGRNQELLLFLLLEQATFLFLLVQQLFPLLVLQDQLAVDVSGVLRLSWPHLDALLELGLGIVWWRWENTRLVVLIYLKWTIIKDLLKNL